MPQISKPVRFKTVKIKALTQSVDGREPPYDVYRLGGGQRKYERPEVPGAPYRRLIS